MTHEYDHIINAEEQQKRVERKELRRILTK